MIAKCTAFLLLFSTGILCAEQESAVRKYCRENQKGILRDYVGFLSIPNEASDTQNIRRNANWILEAMRSRGWNPRLLEAKNPASPPAVYGEMRAAGAKRTLLFYAHYDGQPANPQEWTITKPWQPVFRDPSSNRNLSIDELTFPLGPETRLYARSASDDKAGVMAILTAFDAVRSSGASLTSDLKFFFEGEEEAGSPHLPEIASHYKDLLRADAWILIDGPVHPSGRKMVDFGVRGDANVDVVVYGPIRPLHSGHYGNWAPNPALLLARLLASMKDESGRVRIEGWYDDVTPLTEKEKRAILEAPNPEEQLKAELCIARPDGEGKSLLELIHEPSLNINGIRSADIGDRARNVIPTTAAATLDLRLVKGNDYKRQYEKLLHHIRKQGYLVLDREPSLEERRTHSRIARVRLQPGSYNAQRTPMDLPISEFVMKAVQSTSSEPVVKWPSAGGSLPLIILEEILECPLIGVPIVNHDNNQHAENENIRLQNLWTGIETISALFTAK